MTRCREKGGLILVGGPSYHNLCDFAGSATATLANQELHDAITSALQRTDAGS